MQIKDLIGWDKLTQEEKQRLATIVGSEVPDSLLDDEEDQKDA